MTRRHLLRRSTAIIAGRRTAWVVAVLPLLLAVAVIVAVGEGERAATSTDGLPDGYDSTAGTALLDQLPRRASSAAIVLFTADRGTLTRSQLAALGPAAGRLNVSGSRVLPSRDGTAAIAPVRVPSGSDDQVSAAVEALREQARGLAPPGVTARVTGPAAVQADLVAVFDGADGRLLIATSLVVAFLLVLTYRSPVLWVVPLLVVGVADRFAAVAATQLMAALDVAWDGATTGILSVLVFGAGTDYALLLISRYRDELRGHTDRYAAMAAALRRTAEAVLASATTVVLGLLTLLLSVFPTTRGLGLACAVGVLVAAGFALVVLPALLVLFGRWVFWPRVPRVGDATTTEANTVFRRVGDRVARRPAVVVTAASIVIALLAVGVGWIRLGLDEADQFLDTPEAISAAERLAESYPAGTSDPAQVVTTGDRDEVLRIVRQTDGVASAEPAETGGGVSVINAVLDGPSGHNGATIERLRAALASHDDTHDDTHVTGSEAQALDEKVAQGRDLRLIVPLILVLVLGGLVVLLRSVVAPVLLVLSVVATYLAAMGSAWWIFVGPLGFDAMDAGVPLLAFLFLVALGVDYNIFLVTRAREESAEVGVRRGMRRALAATGGVITSAGVLLAAVFAVLGVLPLVVLAQLGTVICIGVLLDTLVVRTLVVPALALVLGDRFWWPRRLDPGSATDRQRTRAVAASE